MHNRIFIILIIPFLLGCRIYSFTGISVEGETMTIQNFFHEADGGPPDMAQKFTDKMRDYFQQNTSLNLVNNDGELLFEGAVVDYKLAPVNQQAANRGDTNDVAAQTRLTISVFVSYTNINNDEFDFERNFSFFADFDNETNLSDIEQELLDEIFDQIILDIFNASVANW